ncbi:nuclear pore complex protein Nup133 [Lucilia sericata]|uniref:nuclear pore complex protein Nup133 n=1 Tax=Lucilia sericata TaxID=13632 RepID=UPI0018A81975|nr:nuclear pore complex protein Nup133 [Lucilia sericata]
MKMDKNLHQQLYSGMARHSLGGAGTGIRARQTSASTFSNVGRKSLGGSALSYAAGGLKKATGGGGSIGQSRYSISGRSNQSFMGIRSDFNLVESYGLQLPVLVNEALTFSEKNQSVSVRCSENGWAWVVHGRRLLVWQYKDVRNASTGNSPPKSAKDLLARSHQRRGGAMAQCRELTLPHCDIGHKASLVSVFLSESQQMASCVAVSPTGDVRYWPSIAHDGSSVDLTNILDGQEFDYMLTLPQQQMPLSYLLVTTTCSMVLLQLQLQNGRHVLQHKTIRQPSGFLGGIGKKFASIIIGMNNANDKENKFVAVACDPQDSGEREAVVAVLADRWIQRWRLNHSGNNEQMLFEDSEIIRKIRDEFQQKFWNVRDSLNVDLQLLDMHIFEGKTYVLAGAVNTTQTPQMYYGMSVLSTSNEGMRLLSFTPFKFSHFYSVATENECLSLRFIICRTHIYIYNDKVVYPLPLANIQIGEIDAEKIEFHLQDDRILSAAVCANIPLIFSRTHGLVSITPGDFDSSDIMNASCTTPEVFSPMGDTTLREQSVLSSSMSNINEQNLYMYELDPDSIYSEFKDEVSQLKAAFIYRLKRNTNMCNSILNDLLRNAAEPSTTGEAAQLDKIVITIAEDLAEDIPATDPRWEQLWEEPNAQKYALGSSSSLQIITQLKEKNLALRHFVEFLHATGLWEKLSSVPSAGGNVLKPTSFVISDINERIIAAIALRSIQNKYNKLIDEAINSLVQRWQERPQGNLTAQDLFYVRICKFQDIFQAFCDLADNRIENQHQSSNLASFISDINTVVLHITTEVINFREQNSTIYSLPAEKMDSFEYLPWTAMSGNIGLRDSLSHLIDISVKYGAHGTSDPDLRQRIYQQILELIDFILDGRKHYLESVRDTEKFNVLQQQFESQRRDLISILIDNNQYEAAAKLAEKYLDFQSLVLLCDVTNNQERLDSYIKKYEEYDFSQFAINWHLRQNRQGEVFERFKGNQAALSQFMRDHPTLGWIQLVFNGDFERASKILFQLAQSETEFVQRKKSMLSLAKLSAFASTGSDLSLQLETINAELNIVDYQEQLSEHLLLAFGYDVEHQKVLKIEEIINLFIAEENETATEFDFRKALELLNYLEDPFEARHKIWCAAILRDNWVEYDTNSAVDYIQNLLFFKLIELCHLMDGDFESFLPPMEEFISSTDLEDLVSNKSFQYLLKLTYEYINDAYKKSDEMMEM